MAEAVFKHKVETSGYGAYFKVIDSYGTSGWHKGDSPDSRSSKTCRKHGVPVNHRSQQITPQEFAKFDYVIGMDKANVDDLRFMKPRGSTARVALFGEWKTDPKFNTIVDDPYYGGVDGFEYNFEQITHFSEEFLKQEIGDLN